LNKFKPFFQENAMLRKTLFPALAAGLVTLLLAAEAQAWGGYHVGYTHVGPNGAYHVGATGVRGGYGGGAVYRGGAAYGGAYRGGAAYGGAYRAGGGVAYRGAAVGGYHYSPSYSGGYAAGVRVYRP
jgi:hypothetical protein